jgi:hypothetical protein
MSSKILHHPEIGHIPSRWPTHKPCGVTLLATCHNSVGKNLNIEYKSFLLISKYILHFIIEVANGSV